MFISYNRFFKRVSRDIISCWVKLVLIDFGIDIFRFKLYSIRVVSMFVVSNVLVSFDDILYIVGWFLEFIFVKFYNKFIVKENIFVDKVFSSVSNI